jgi:pimeloyl-ACP methyl ester carboxylesterase
MEKNLTLYPSRKKLYYTVSGSGVAVMLVHGFAEDGSIWENQRKALESFYKVIIPDLPGSGKSERLDEGSMEIYADAIHEIVITEKLSSLVMIGHSMGGYITLAYAEKYSSSLSAFGLFHSSAYADDEEKIETRKKGIRFITANGAAKFLEQATPALFSEKTKSNTPGIIEEIISRYANFEAESLVQYYESMIARPDRTKVLKESNSPVLFILGTYDNAVPLNKGLEQTHLPDICYIHICKNSGHMGMLEESSESNEVLKSFINQTGRQQV